MELDDLRRQWQQPPAETPAFDNAALARLLARGSGSPVAKMRRNAWLEMGSVGGCGVVCGVAVANADDAYTRSMAVWLILTCLFSSLYFWRKLRVLHALGDASGAVRARMARQLSSLRALVRLYYHVTLWSLPISFGIGLLYIAGSALQRFTGHKLLVFLGGLGGAYVAAGVLAYFGLRSFTTSYLQRLYGQHLDRLEASLHELGDEPAA